MPIMKHEIVLYLLVALVPRINASWDSGMWDNGCADSCAKEWLDFQGPDDTHNLCSNEFMSSAAACVATASCNDQEKTDITASISSMCVEGSAGSIPTKAAQWSQWGGDTDGPWSRGGPFGGGWGPWGENGPWTSMGPWTSWWDGDDCPGSTWSGWTDGPWSTKADWTTWDECTATSTPVVLTTTVDGVQSVTTTYEIQVAQVTGSPETSSSSETDPAESASGPRNNLNTGHVALAVVAVGMVVAVIL